ncbi:alpha/beta fold hydrolase [Micrococcus sp. TA1]|uniref:alpha/beta fold hydrolase n=1 Tax=Micrococcus sp. TA1 TaxID=681627 RepID=UPI001617C8FC|nr:alpha/beta hydrolase [Micrococcus sp. TA1]MBB5747967.1 pimeloyl-ACP methyl ester carboxylesterase [Micrococcus sp. TA1]
MLHDAGSDRRSFRHQVSAFAPGTDLLVPDLRGHGESILHEHAIATLEGVLADLEALLRAVGAEQMVVVGHGVGAQIAQELAHRHPGLVQRLVLISGQDHHRTPDPAGRLRLRVQHALAHCLPWSWVVRSRARASTTNPALRQELTSTSLAAGQEVVLDLERTTTQHRHPVAHYRMPVLVLDGQHPDSARREAIPGCIAARSSRGSTVAIDDAGTLCHLEQPEATNATIRTFLAR